MSALDRLRHAWRLACVSSTSADNLIRVDGVLYAIAEPVQQQNGALRGRIFRHNGGGFTDCGGYKLAADGRVVELIDELRGPLALEAPAEQTRDRWAELSDFTNYEGTQS